MYMATITDVVSSWPHIPVPVQRRLASRAMWMHELALNPGLSGEVWWQMWHDVSQCLHANIQKEQECTTSAPELDAIISAINEGASLLYALVTNELTSDKRRAFIEHISEFDSYAHSAVLTFLYYQELTHEELLLLKGRSLSLLAAEHLVVRYPTDHEFQRLMLPTYSRTKRFRVTCVQGTVLSAKELANITIEALLLALDPQTNYSEFDEDDTYQAYALSHVWRQLSQYLASCQSNESREELAAHPKCPNELEGTLRRSNAQLAGDYPHYMPYPTVVGPFATRPRASSYGIQGRQVASISMQIGDDEQLWNTVLDLQASYRATVSLEATIQDAKSLLRINGKSPANPAGLFPLMRSSNEYVILVGCLVLVNSVTPIREVVSVPQHWSRHSRRRPTSH
jgi:hypothetical protein